jgi:hypothetical protein
MLTGDLIKNNKSIYSSRPDTSRTTMELAPLLIKLLFHELAHANDFFPHTLYKMENFDSSKSYYETAEIQWDAEKTLSQKMKTPLISPDWIKAGSILYQGEKADTDALNTTAQTMVREFIADGAVDPYAYSTSNEDLAMLVEESLLRLYYEYDSYVIIIKLPHANFTIPETFTHPIAGGVKNKISAPHVKVRALDVIERMFDSAFAQKISQSLDLIKPVIIPEDTRWENLTKL